MTILSYVGLAGLLLALAAAIGANFRVGRNTAALTNYKAISESWEKKAGLLEAQLAESERQIAHLRGQVATLQGLVTGTTAAEQLAHQFTELAARIDARATETLAQMSSARGELRDIHTAITGRPPPWES